jgi:heme A synthase
MAFGLFSMLLWTGLDVLGKTPSSYPNATKVFNLAGVARLRPVATVACLLTGITAASGAFVAGNDAGYAYNDWPLFAGRVVPEHIWDDKVLLTAHVFQRLHVVPAPLRVSGMAGCALASSCPVACVSWSSWAP